mmetsp:Transcript_23367/g.37402  ORF Transcript_23367/g.37402 Transcript_23367/m.37402 type:complete len:300 (+) Transcript_23367:138-1037(+)
MAAPRVSALVPLHRYYNGKDHLYTTNLQEIGTIPEIGSSGRGGYKYDGVACYVSSGPQADLVVLHRVYRKGGKEGGDHLYTTNFGEVQRLVSHKGNSFENIHEGASAYVSNKGGNNLIPLHRYVNAKGDHFYTTNLSEIGATSPGVVGNGGYKYESIACYVYNPPAECIGIIPHLDKVLDFRNDSSEKQIYQLSYNVGISEKSVKENSLQIAVGIKISATSGGDIWGAKITTEVSTSITQETKTILEQSSSVEVTKTGTYSVAPKKRLEVYQKTATIQMSGGRSFKVASNMTQVKEYDL